MSETENGSSKSANEGNGGTAPHIGSSTSDINPYAVLNISPDANTEAIQKSYKSLSRSFHPDKQPPGKNRDIAQQYFVQLKASYDILNDPVLRLAYDNYGNRGIRIISKFKTRQLYNNIEELLTQLNEDDDEHRRNAIILQAREILSDIMQSNDFDNTTKPKLSAGITVKCNATHSPFLGEGFEDNSQSSMLEVEATRMNISIRKSPDAKTSISFSGHGGVENNSGKASSGAQISVNHEPTPGTDVNIDLDIGSTPDETKVSFGTSRVMSSRTYFSATMNVPASIDTPTGIAITSQRSMMRNKVLGTWIMGVGLPNFQLQYGMLSFTTNYPDQPTCKAVFNVGMDYTPINLSVEKEFGSDEGQHNHKGKVSWGYGPRGVDLKAITTWDLSNYCRVVTGLHHVSAKGLTWLFQLNRGSIQFSVPILITTAVSPAYTLKSLYMTLLFGLFDTSLGELVRKEVNEAAKNLKMSTDSPENRALRREEILFEREKVKRDALQQISLMKKPAEQKRRKEQKTNGLVITNAVYSVTGGDSIDVTTALMFWVVKGRLQLPSTTKSSMLGFYDVRREGSIAIESGYVNACWKIWEKFWYNEKKVVAGSSSAVPVLLTIRYQYQGDLYEVTIADDEAISLPSPKAMKLGGSHVK